MKNDSEKRIFFFIKKNITSKAKGKDRKRKEEPGRVMGNHLKSHESDENEAEKKKQNAQMKQDKNWIEDKTQKIDV